MYYCVRWVSVLLCEVGECIRWVSVLLCEVGECTTV